MDHVTFTQYCDGINAVYKDCRLRKFDGMIISGGLANPSSDSLAYIEAAMKKLPKDLVVGIHRYSYKAQTDVTRPWPPFRSRETELAEIKRIAFPRDVAITEFGYHTAEEEVGFFDAIREGKRPYKTRLTDEQVRENLVYDLKLYDKAGVILAVIYQYRDGPSDSFINRFGLHTVDGAAKPQSQAIKDYKSWQS
jgi:hypothetical protein